MKTISNNVKADDEMKGREPRESLSQIGYIVMTKQDLDEVLIEF